MNNNEKIEIIKGRIVNLDFHIDILARDILENPDADMDEKPERQDVLDDLILSKEAIKHQLDLLIQG